MDEKKLYHFLKTHENGIAKINGKVEAWAHVEFDEIEALADIVHDDVVCEGYVKATIMQDNIAVDLIDSVLFCNEIKDYKNCFNKEDCERARG